METDQYITFACYTQVEKYLLFWDRFIYCIFLLRPPANTEDWSEVEGLGCGYEVETGATPTGTGPSSGGKWLISLCADHACFGVSVISLYSPTNIRLGYNKTHVLL